jgi:mono/diheme cytochrome c family protein
MRYLALSRLAVAAAVSATASAAITAPSSAQAADGGALSSTDRERVERLLERRVACRGCHAIGGSGGLIGPPLDGIAERAERGYVLGVIHDPSGTIPGTIMPHQPIPSDDADRLATYLMELPPRAPAAAVGAPQAPPTVTPEQNLDGAALYARHCAACHGESGAGDGWNAANLPVTPTAHSDPALMSVRPDDTLYDAIAAGGYVLDKSARMPAFGRMLEPEQIRALVEHIRGLCGCAQPVWARG